MKKKTFKAEILAGHKDAAIEVPFDPAWAWDLDARALWRGRRGFEVKGKLNGCAFESFIVPRSKKFWMLVDGALKSKAKVAVGDVVSVSVEPLG
jgi:Domain of unknown function (DUF1905)